MLKKITLGNSKELSCYNASEIMYQLTKEEYTGFIDKSYIKIKVLIGEGSDEWEGSETTHMTIIKIEKNGWSNSRTVTMGREYINANQIIAKLVKEYGGIYSVRKKDSVDGTVEVNEKYKEAFEWLESIEVMYNLLG
jgi:exo-beta-1,3-glucanase (GH17 family)